MRPGSALKSRVPPAAALARPRTALGVGNGKIGDLFCRVARRVAHRQPPKPPQQPEGSMPAGPDRELIPSLRSHLGGDAGFQCKDGRGAYAGASCVPRWKRRQRRDTSCGVESRRPNPTELVRHCLTHRPSRRALPRPLGSQRPGSCGFPHSHRPRPASDAAGGHMRSRSSKTPASVPSPMSCDTGTIPGMLAPSRATPR